jgi:hypothetical protein
MTRGGGAPVTVWISLSDEFPGEIPTKCLDKCRDLTIGLDFRENPDDGCKAPLPLFVCSALIKGKCGIL